MDVSHCVGPQTRCLDRMVVVGWGAWSLRLRLQTAGQFKEGHLNCGSISCRKPPQDGVLFPASSGVQMLDPPRKDCNQTGNKV